MPLGVEKTDRAIPGQPAGFGLILGVGKMDRKMLGQPAGTHVEGA